MKEMTPDQTRSRDLRFPPWLGLICAVLSFAAMMGIWIAGPFGNAHNDDLGMISVLVAGSLAALAGAITGFRWLDSAEQSTAKQISGGLLGVLNLAAIAFLIYCAVRIWNRLY